MKQRSLITLLALVLLGVVAKAQPAIKVFNNGQIAFQSSTGTYGIQIPTNGVASFEPNITTSYNIINVTKLRSQLTEAWVVRNVNYPASSNKRFCVLGNGNVCAYGSYLNTIPYPSKGQGGYPIENASGMISQMNGYYFTSHEFDGITPEDFEDNENILPGALEGLLKDLAKDKTLCMDAEALEAVLPEAVRHDNEGHLAINYNAVLIVLVEAFKEQQSTIESLQKELTDLKTGFKGSYGIESMGNAKNVLFQNIPNPTNSSTTINCYLDSYFSKATIAIYDLNGLQLKEYSVYHQGKNTITIEANEFKPGIYMYSLLVDEKLVDTKRMVITAK